MSGYVYAILAGSKVKIGWSDAPRKRFSKISSDSPIACELVGAIPASLAIEAAFHAEFADWHLHGEWFSNAGRVKEFVTALSRNRIEEETREPVIDPSWHPIKKWRKKRGLSMVEFAELVGTTQPTISRIETGRATSVSLALAIQSATAGDVTVGDIFNSWMEKAAPAEARAAA